MENCVFLILNIPSLANLASYLARMCMCAKAGDECKGGARTFSLVELF